MVLTSKDGYRIIKEVMEEEQEKYPRPVVKQVLPLKAESKILSIFLLHTRARYAIINEINLWRWLY